MLRQVSGSAPILFGLVADVIRGVALRQARSPLRVLRWDLVVDLAFLREAPFDLLHEASLLWLTLETAFLLALALARRSSELVSISGLPNVIGFSRGGSVSLKFLPEFLAKTRTQRVLLLCLTFGRYILLVSASEPVYLDCPVRALREYRARTRHARRKGGGRVCPCCAREPM